MQNQIKTSTKKDLEKFIDKSSFKKIFLVAGSTSYTESGLKNFFSILQKKILKFFLRRKTSLNMRN